MSAAAPIRFKGLDFVAYFLKGPLGPPSSCPWLAVSRDACATSLNLAAARMERLESPVQCITARGLQASLKAGIWIGLLGLSCFVDVGAVERLLRAFAAFEGLGAVEFRVPDVFPQQPGFNSGNFAAPKADPQPFRGQMVQQMCSLAPAELL